MTAKTNVSRGTALLISIYFPPEPGGASTAAWNRATILHKIGFYVFILCGFPSYPTGKVYDKKYRGKLFSVEKYGEFTLIRLRLLPLKTSGYLNRLILFVNFVLLCLFFAFRILRTTGRINLIYSIAPIIFSSFIGFVYSKLNGSYFIHEVSDLWPEELVVFSTRLFFIIFHLGKIVARLSYNFPDMLVAISHLAAEQLTTSYKPRATIYVLPIGVDLDKFHVSSKEESRRKLNNENLLPTDMDGKFIVLYTGLISKATRVENLVLAARDLQNENTEISFLIVGDGEEKQKLEELKSVYDIKNLIMLPFQPRDMIPIIISACDVCVVSLPSVPIYDVDVPTKFYEYLAGCKPQIGICGGDLAKIITSNDIGLTVKDGQISKLVESILCLKNSPSLINSMKKNSRSLLGVYSLDSLASNFSCVLENAMEKSRARIKN